MRPLLIFLLALSTIAASAKERGYTRKEVKRLDRLISKLSEFKALRAKNWDGSTVRSFFIDAPSADSAKRYLYVVVQRGQYNNSIKVGTLMGDCLPGYFGKLPQPTVSYTPLESYLLKYDRKAKVIIAVTKSV